MQLTIVEQNRIPTIITEHEGRVIHWSGRQYMRRNLVEQVNVVSHINDFWSRSPLATQGRIFDIYERCYAVIDTVREPYDMLVALRPLVAELCEMHSVDAIRNWYTWFGKGIYIPKEMEEHYQVSDRTQVTRERTYTRTDYEELVFLVMMLRPIVPIWGEMIERVSAEVGTSNKEYTAFQILAQSSIMQAPGMEKLLLYVQHNIEAVAKTAAIAVDGLGTEELPQNILASVLVNRVCVGDLTATQPDENGVIAYNLVVAVFKALMARFNTANNTGAAIEDQVRRKNAPQGKGDNPDDISTFEAFKIKERFAAGTFLPYCIFTELHDEYADAVTQDRPREDGLKLVGGGYAIDHGLYAHFRANAGHMKHYVPETCQVRIANYVVGHVTPPEVGGYLSQQQTINMITLAQTWLWQHGHRWLAALIAARPASGDAMMVSSTGTLQKLPTEQKEMLMKLYPMNRHTRNRQRSRASNPVLMALDEVCEQFNSHDWLICLPDEMARVMFPRGHGARVACPAEIRALVALMLKDVAAFIHGETLATI